MSENVEPKQKRRRLHAGNWKPGQSGNPAGKAKGTLHHATRAAMALLDGEAEALTRKAIEKAKEGDEPRCAFASSASSLPAKIAR